MVVLVLALLTRVLRITYTPLSCFVDLLEFFIHICEEVQCPHVHELNLEESITARTVIAHWTQAEMGVVYDQLRLFQCRIPVRITVAYYVTQTRYKCGIF